MQCFITIKFLCIAVCVIYVSAWRDENDAVLLKDVNVLTLHSGRMTTARRSSAVPQLKCVGGTAGCGSFLPQVVQCYNRGSDGFDVQWECKSDMDNAYRFGKVEVSCEGYNYPDDPYILKGSCGLEYTIDLTQEGHQKQYDSGHQYQHNYYSDNHRKKSSNWFGDLIMLVIVGVIIYAIYVTCLGGGNNATDSGNPPPYSADDANYRPRGNPPPYGFRNEYMPHDGGADCSSGRTYGGYTNTQANTGRTGGGFWTGAGVGGMLGYLFGSRTNTGYYGPSYGYDRGYGGGSWWNRGYGGWGGNSWGGGWNSGGFGSNRTYTRSSSGFSRSGGSTGTRTASGFGGTSRR